MGGAAYGTAKSGVGICSMGVMRPDMVMRSIIPVVMAGVLGIYGLITAVIINGKMTAGTYSAYSGYAHLGAGLTVGMSLILIFAEALGLYGLIVGLVVASTAEGKGNGIPPNNWHRCELNAHLPALSSMSVIISFV